MSEPPDPTIIRVIAVTVEDVITATEMNVTTSRHAVLRITPPFSGRMRARLHVEQEGEYGNETTRPIHVDPASILADDAPSYPRPAETEDELRNDPTVTYTVDRHHEHHTAAVEEWRQSLSDAIRDRTRIDTPDGPHEIGISTLGTPPTDDPLRPDENAE